MSTWPIVGDRDAKVVGISNFGQNPIVGLINQFLITFLYVVIG